MTTKCCRYWVTFVLLSVTLPLTPRSLTSKQKQGIDNSGAPQLTSGPTGAPHQKSDRLCALRTGPARCVRKLEAIVDRMSQATIRNETHLSPYTVTREYELFARDPDKARSRVIVNITFLPPDSKNYSVRRTEGSAIGEMVVRRVLKREVVIQRDSQSTDISPENYNFQFVREESANGQHCYVLRMLPGRKSKNLLRGTVWVDATTYLIHRIEGEPEENPSWWVRNVHIVLIFGDVGGMWLPTSSEYTARVRLLGPSAMVGHDLRYSYPLFAKSGKGVTERRPELQTISLSFSAKRKEVH
jgi:hypothetical protein